MKMRRLTISFVFSVMASTVWAGSIAGVVRDDGEQPPNDGIKNAIVTIAGENGFKRELNTAADGTYVITDVPRGKAMIKVRKDGFVKDPTEIEVMIEGDEKLETHMWVPGAEKVTYFRAVADNMIKRGKLNATLDTSLSIEWVNVTHAQVPIKFKWQLANALEQSDSKAGDALPILAQYGRLDEKQIRELEVICLRVAKRTDSKFELKEFKNMEDLSSMVLTDALITTLNSRHLSKDNRVEFGEVLVKRDFLNRDARSAILEWTKLAESSAALKNPGQAGEQRIIYDIYLDK